jgi:hypothetical protein
MIKNFNDFLNESRFDRNRKIKINLSDVKYAYHWVTEGKLFDACYGPNVQDDDRIVLDMGPMPALPKPSYKLSKICLTVDPEYMDPAFNEDGSCIVFDFQRLRRDFDIEDLTDNGEAEIRIQSQILNWPRYIVQLDISRESYEFGVEWEEFDYRPIKEWLPRELKNKVEIFKSHEKLMQSR